jgi:polyhydroxyalkanoate synthesis regulator phasin
MPAKKRARKKAVRRRPAIRVRRAKGRLEKTWTDTQAALGSAEAAVEKRVKALVRRSGVDTRQARQTLATWRQRLHRERKKATKQFESRLAVLQTRARKERRVFTRAVEDAVQRTLAALNIPSRHEVHELTRRIEELSRRIDRFRR